MRNPREATSRALLLIALVLSGLGVVFVFSSSSAMTAASSDYGHDPFFYLKRQALFLALGLVAMALVRRLDLLRWRVWLSLPLLLVSLGLLAAVLVVGEEVNGARRWLAVGPFNFQVSELAKLAWIFYLADCLARRRERLTSGRSLVPLLVLLGATAYLVEQQPDLGTLLVVVAVFMAMLYVAGARLWHLAAMSLAGVAAVAVMIWQKPYRLARLETFLNPGSDLQGAGYQLYNSLIALGSGGVWGRGLSHSVQKFNYLPEQHTDFIFAIIGEELGLVGTAAVVVLYSMLLWAGFKLGANCRRPYLSLLAVGITFQICGQALLNIGVVTGTLPSTGIPLPFLSYGGSSLLFSLVGVGVLLNISDSSSRQALASGERRRERRRMRRGSTLDSSSQEPQECAVARREWESEVARARPVRPPSSLPRPPVRPVLRIPPIPRRGGTRRGGRGFPGSSGNFPRKLR